MQLLTYYSRMGEFYSPILKQVYTLIVGAKGFHDSASVEHVALSVLFHPPSPLLSRKSTFFLETSQDKAKQHEPESPP